MTWAHITVKSPGIRIAFGMLPHLAKREDVHWTGALFLAMVRSHVAKYVHQTALRVMPPF